MSNYNAYSNVTHFVIEFFESSFSSGVFMISPHETSGVMLTTSYSIIVIFIYDTYKILIYRTWGSTKMANIKNYPFIGQIEESFSVGMYACI